MTPNHRHHIKYTFRPLTLQDLTRLHQWFQEPVIHQMYARNQLWSLNDITKKYQPRIMGKENIPSFIIELNNQPIGFIQYYCLGEHLPEGIANMTNPLFNQYNPREIAGIDLFIADDTNRGMGHGKMIINQFIAEFLMRYRLIVVDPESHNIQAIQCYEKSGFGKTDLSSNKHYLLLIKETKKQDKSIRPLINTKIADAPNAPVVQEHEKNS